MRKHIFLAAAVLITLCCPPVAAAAPAPIHGYDHERRFDPCFAPPSFPVQQQSFAAKTAAADVRIPPAGDRGYDVLHYGLDIAVDPQAETIAGRVRIDLSARRDGLTEVALDLVDGMIVDSLLWSGTAATFVHAGDSLGIAPPAPMSAGEEASVLVVYHGAPQPHGNMNVGLLFRSHGGPTDSPADDVPVIFSVGEPWSSHSWWPCKDHPSDKATADVTVTAPEPLVAVSNGRLLGVDSPGPGLRTYRWREGYPIATYLIGVSISDYVEWEETCAAAAGDLPLTFHFFPQDEQKARAELAATCDMMLFLERICGPYPFPAERYGQVEIVWAGAMEHQTATSLAQFLLTGDGRWETIFLHELAHQWFGDRMTPAGWSDIWLNEGFARYCEALWIEEQQGSAAYLAAMREMGPLRHPDLFAGEGTLIDPDPILPNQLIYDKGAWVLHILRGAIGDRAFFGFLHDYAADPETEGGNVTTAEMLAAATAAAGIDAADLLGPWLETDAVPEVEWSYRNTPLSRGGSRLTLDIRQTQDVLFELPLMVRVMSTAGDFDLRADLGARTGSFEWDLPASADSVAVDPDGWLLLHQSRRDPAPLDLLPPSPNPAGNSGVTIRYLVRAGGRITAAAYDVRGRRLGSWPLGEHEASETVHRWIWQGNDDQGRAAPSGTYWLVLDGGGGRDVRQVTLIR